MTTIDCILAGRIVLLPDGETPSAIAKRPIGDAVDVGPEGIAADAQADRSVHGGPDKALLHYAFDHYAAWRDELGEGTPEAFAAPGAFGENLSSSGLTEAGVCLGDAFRIGGVLVEVSQARQPCFKLNVRHGRDDLAWRVERTGRTGWYYRVLEAGRIRLGDAVLLVDRPNPDWPLPRAQVLLGPGRSDPADLSALAALPQLAEAWRRAIARKLGR